MQLSCALNTLVEIIFNEDATYGDLLYVVLFFSFFWFLVFTAAAIIIRPFTYGKPWLVAAGERDYERGGKDFNKKIGLPSQTKEEFVDSFMSRWPWTVSLALQHLVGGSFCVPALIPGHFGLDHSTASSLACLGILSEMGWELEDMASIIYKRFASVDGKNQVSNTLLAVLAIHHSLTCILGLPAIINYRNMSTLHWLCFDLQAAAGVAIAVIEYTKVLDIKKKSELLQFQALTGLTFAFMVYTRAIHWTYLCFEFFSMWYAERNWPLLIIGSAVSIIFTVVVNYGICIQPFYTRFTKCLNYAVKLDVSEPRKENEKVSTDPLNLTKHIYKIKVEMFQSSFPQKQIARRATMSSSLLATRRARQVLSSPVLRKSICI